MSEPRRIDLDAFKKWVGEALQDARGRGMVDADIQKAVDFNPRTFHRWQAGDFGPEGPKLPTVFKFCDGLGLDRRIPARMLGFEAEPATSPPRPPAEPEVPEDVRVILAQLRDPNVPDRDKEFLLESLKLLAARYRSRVVGRGAGRPAR